MTRSPLSELLFVLAVTWLAVLGHAALPQPLVVLGTPLERPVALSRAAPAHLDRLELPTVDAPTPTTSAEPIPAPSVDPTPQRILLVGDSMVERLMQRFAAYAHDNGHALHPAIWYASTTIGWARDAKLERLVHEIDPTFVVVVLGSSELTMRHVERLTPAVRRILTVLRGRSLVWIGPPNWREDSGINALLERELGKARFFRSADMSFERAADGIHPSWNAAATWMDAIATWIASESATPIVLEPPTTEVPRPSARVFPPPRTKR